MSRQIFKGLTPLQRLWIYSKAAVALHLRFLAHADKGLETHSVVVMDIPGCTDGVHSLQPAMNCNS